MEHDFEWFVLIEYPYWFYLSYCISGIILKWKSRNYLLGHHNLFKIGIIRKDLMLFHSALNRNQTILFFIAIEVSSMLNLVRINWHHWILKKPLNWIIWITWLISIFSHCSSGKLKRSKLLIICVVVCPVYICFVRKKAVGS